MGLRVLAAQGERLLRRQVVQPPKACSWVWARWAGMKEQTSHFLVALPLAGAVGWEGVITEAPKAGGQLDRQPYWACGVHWASPER